MGVMNAADLQISDWLGVKDATTDSDFLRLVEGRLATSVIKRLTVLGFERSEINAAIIPARTLQQRRSRREKLTIEESDRVLRVIRLVSTAAVIYGSRERALSWMRKPQPRLGGRTPLSLLTTDTGSRMVEELLIQIDEGMYI